MNNRNSMDLWTLAIPIALEAFFQMLFGFADTYVLSQYSNLSVAAVGYVNQFLSIILLLFRVCASGTSILLAQSIGAKNTNRQLQICTAALTISSIVGLISFVIIRVFCKNFIHLLQMDKSLWMDATSYLTIMSYGLFFQAMFTIFTAIFRNYHKAFFTSFISVFANLLNVIGDLLVVSKKLHLFGTVKDVALVTVLSNFTAFLLILFIFLFHKGIRIISIPSKNICKEIIRLGLPAVGESCSYKCSQMAITVFIGLLGTNAMTAKIYTMNLTGFIILLPNSIAIAAGILVGIAAGAKDNNKEQLVVTSCLKKGNFTIIVLDFIFLLFGQTFLKIFTTDSQILSLSYFVLILDMITMFAKNGNLIYGNSLRAIGDVIYPVKISILSMWIIGTGFAFIIGMKFGLVGFYVAFLLDEVIRSLLLKKRWYKETKRSIV